MEVEHRTAPWGGGGQENTREMDQMMLKLPYVESEKVARDGPDGGGRVAER